MKSKVLRLRRTVTKTRQRALAAFFAPVMLVIAALAAFATNAVASAASVGGGSTAAVRPADAPATAIQTGPATQTIIETISVSPTETVTESQPVSPIQTITETVSVSPTESISQTYSVTPTQTITVTATPTPKCVSNSKSISYYKDVKGGIDVVVGGHNLWLCHPIYAQSVGWTYEKTTSMWPQNHPVAGKLVIIAKSGTYFVPAGVGCEVDFYASVGKAPAYPAVLTAPGKPYEPKFLNTYFSGTNAVMFYITPAQCQCGKEKASL